MRTISVYDERFESGPRLVGEHENVPSTWTKKDVMERFGIGEHLSVYELCDGETREMNSGDRYGGYVRPLSIRFI